MEFNKKVLWNFVRFYGICKGVVPFSGGFVTFNYTGFIVVLLRNGVRFHDILPRGFIAFIGV